MDWKDISSLVGKAAPLIGTALGGPAGGAIGSLVANTLGVDSKPEKVAEAIKNNPEALLKIEELEKQNEADIRKHAFLVLDAELKDKQSAREHHKHSPMPGIICGAVTFMVAVGAYLLFTIEIPQDNREIAYLLFGTLLAKWGDSIAYWVGTTRSSAEKTRLLK